MDPFNIFAVTKVRVAPAPMAAGTTLTVDDPSVFPSPPFQATVWNAKDNEPTPENSETVQVTAVSGKVLTIVRAQEGSTAKKLWVGFNIAQLPTKVLYQSIEDDAVASAVPQAVAQAVPIAVAQATLAAQQNVAGLFDASLPLPLGTASSGSALQVSRRDHVHEMPKLDDLATPDDNTDLNASTSRHGLVLKATAPGAGLQNVVAIRNGETAYTNKALFDTANAAALGAAAPGTALVAARQDHVHEMPKLDDVAAPDDNTDLDASTTKHGLVLKATAPAAGVRNVVCIDNAETAYKNAALLDSTNPEPLGTASPGTSLLAARRDHIHQLLKLDDAAAPDDNTDLDASTTSHGLLVKATAPAAGDLNVVGIGNGETVYTNKAIFDSTNPETIGTAAPGTSTVAARRDHVHDLPTNVAIAGAFGCNGASAQTAYASGGALNAYTAGAYGLGSNADMNALYVLVVNMRAALVANGIMS